jgi:hypothetical protein
MEVAVVSPVGALLTARCTPELERVQAELGARTSFWEAARILETLLPASPANHESVRIRTHAAALRLEAADRQAAAAVVARDTATAEASRPIVMLDGAYVRAVPGHQVRNFEVICGKVEQEGRASRRFGLVRSVAEQPHVLLRAAEPVDHAPLEHAQADIERLRHLLWNGYHEEAGETLDRIASWAETAISLNGGAVQAKAGRLVAHCTELRGYIGNNEGALIDYGQRYRAGKPISTSRAEGAVNHLVNARMNKRRQMRWSPRGAHRVLQVRAAVLDGRFGQQAIQLAA